MKTILFQPLTETMGCRCPHWGGPGDVFGDPFPSGSTEKQNLTFVISIEMKDGVAMKDPDELKRLKSKISDRITKAIEEVVAEKEKEKA